MGTLMDITSKAANRNLRSGGSPSSTPKNTASQTEKTTRANFMTPTMASTKKTSADSTSKAQARTSTPTSINVEKAVTGKWMASAAKRVGFRRAGADGTRPKKEGSKQSQTVLTFPDKLAAPLQGPVPDSPRPTKAIAPFLSEKPLPSPPIAQVQAGCVEEPRSLIDASEKPLERTSPKSPRKKEEWPVLFPRKPMSSENIQEVPHHGSPKPPPIFSTDQERYPRLTGPSVSTAISQRPMNRAPSSQTVQRRQASKSNLHDMSVLNRSTDGHGDRTVNLATEQASVSLKTLAGAPKATHRLSAAAAAVEKSSSEVRSVQEPRQTRTSSLRARISAGQIIKDSPNKVLGFTDFTTQEVTPTRVSREESESNAGFRARSSSSFSKTFTKKPSRESQGGNRAPAQFVAGSRRPTARRPGSRNSLRSESRASSPAFLEPSRPAPPIPVAKPVPYRKSSIPVSRNPPLTAATTNDLQPPPAEGAAALQAEVNKQASTNLELPEYTSGASANEHSSRLPIVGYSDENSYLESIAESPRSTFRSKRLSTRSPMYGPELKISSSANRLILGETSSDRDITPIVKKKKSIDLFRAAITNERKTVSAANTLIGDHKKTLVRPVSSQGFSESQTREVSVARASRTKKVNSVDLGSTSSSVNSKPEPITQSSEKDDERQISSTTEVPFCAIQAQSCSDARGLPKQEHNEGANPVSCSASTTPANPTGKEGATLTCDSMAVIPDVLPEKHQENAHKMSKIAPAEHTKLQRTSSPSLPSTPQHGNQNDGSPSSSTFPPRSSSRQKHPDFTLNGSTKSSSMSSVEREAAHLQEGSSSAHAVEAKVADSEASQRLPSIGKSKSSREIASQTILADVGCKRNSAAHESSKSQTSVSKGLKSTFRGLFHKRTADNAEGLNPRSARKGGRGPTVTAHGSPFPSMSNIHPIYRPTQSSMNRASAAAQRPNSYGIPTVAPSTPIMASPLPSEISTTTTLAMDILESARRESHSPKKERLLELGKLMVDTITQARDAEKAMEEAKQAARKAEVAHALCKKSVSDVAKLVKDWRSDVRQV
ncbi:MAG: hypothetical protein Q9197_003260 [Variospora fuerteventurae]